MVPVSALNALRKEALEELLALREGVEPHPFREPAPLELPPRQRPARPELRVRVEKAAQLSPALTQNAALVILPVEELWDHRELLREPGGLLAA